MLRAEATKELRDLLDAQDLKDWHVRLTSDLNKPFLGLCSYKDKAIILNAHHIDTHPIEEIRNTIKHEVAHALTPGHGHDEIWRAKARELGCDNTEPCASYGFSPEVIDAIRSGADVKVTFEEEVIRKPKYEITRLQDKCHVCNLVIKSVSSTEFIAGTPSIRYKKKTYQCGHFAVVKADSQTFFENFITVEHRNNGCVHDWSKNLCTKCGANRPFPFQIVGMQALEKANGRLLIADEMGLGKTIQALGYLWAANSNATPILAIVKSGIKYQWQEAVLNWLGEKYFPQILNSSKEQFLPGFKFYIVSYDLLRRLDSSQLDRLIKTIKPKTLILDEVQHIKNPDSTRTQEVRKLAKQIPNVIPLSGTPWKNRGSEFFTVLNILDPQRFGSFERFKRDWVQIYWEGNRQKEGGIRNPLKFKEHIADLMIRRERSEVMPELPIISRNRNICELPKSARDAYENAEDNLINDWNAAVISGEEDSFETKKKLMENLMVMKQIVGIAKIPATVDFACDFLEETDRKLVIFVHHKACGQLIFNQLSEFAREHNMAQPLQLTADMSSEERYATQVKFNSNGTRLLVASTLASGEGLNLQTCSDCIMHERQWNPANEEQAEGRFIRIGQQANAVNATYMHGKDSCDTQLDAIVERKRQFFHAAMNKGQMPTWNESDLIKELVKSIAANRKK